MECQELCVTSSTATAIARSLCSCVNTGKALRAQFNFVTSWHHSFRLHVVASKSWRVCACCIVTMPSGFTQLKTPRDSSKQKRGPRGIMGNLIYYYAASNSVYGTGNLHISARPLAHIIHNRQPCPPTFRFHRKLVNVHMNAACEAIFARWCDFVIHCMQTRTNATPLYAV